MPFAAHGYGYGGGYAHHYGAAQVDTIWLYIPPEMLGWTMTPYLGATYWDRWAGFDVRWAAYMNWMDDSLYDIWRIWQSEISVRKLSVHDQRKVLTQLIHRTLPELRKREVEEHVERMMETTNRIGADQYGHVEGFSSSTTTTTTTTTATADQRFQAGMAMQQAMTSKGAPQAEIDQTVKAIVNGEKDGFVIQYLESTKNQPPAQQQLALPPAQSSSSSSHVMQSSSSQLPYQSQLGMQMHPPQPYQSQLGMQIQAPQPQIPQPAQSKSSSQGWQMSYNAQGAPSLPGPAGNDSKLTPGIINGLTGMVPKDGADFSGSIGLPTGPRGGADASGGMPFGSSTTGSNRIITTTTTTEEYSELSSVGFQQMGMAQLTQSMGGLAVGANDKKKSKSRSDRTEKSSKKKGKEPMNQVVASSSVQQGAMLAAQPGGLTMMQGQTGDLMPLAGAPTIVPTSVLGKDEKKDKKQKKNRRWI